MEAEARKKAIRVLHAASLAGALRPEIDQIYDFQNCAQAHDDILQGGRTGVSLIRI